MSTRTSILEETESPEKLREMFKEMKGDDEKDLVSRLAMIENKFEEANDRIHNYKSIIQSMARKRHDRIATVKMNKEKLLQDSDYSYLSNYYNSYKKVNDQCKRLTKH